MDNHEKDNELFDSLERAWGGDIDSMERDEVKGKKIWLGDIEYPYSMRTKKLREGATKEKADTKKEETREKRVSSEEQAEKGKLKEFGQKTERAAKNDANKKPRGEKTGEMQKKSGVSGYELDDRLLAQLTGKNVSKDNNEPERGEVQSVLEETRKIVKQLEARIASLEEEKRVADEERRELIESNRALKEGIERLIILSKERRDAVVPEPVADRLTSKVRGKSARPERINATAVTEEDIRRRERNKAEIKKDVKNRKSLSERLRRKWMKPIAVLLATASLSGGFGLAIGARGSNGKRDLYHNRVRTESQSATYDEKEDEVSGGEISEVENNVVFDVMGPGQFNEASAVKDEEEYGIVDLSGGSAETIENVTKKGVLVENGDYYSIREQAYGKDGLYSRMNEKPNKVAFSAGVDEVKKAVAKELGKSASEVADAEALLYVAEQSEVAAAYLSSLPDELKPDILKGKTLEETERLLESASSENYNKALKALERALKSKNTSFDRKSLSGTFENMFIAQKDANGGYSSQNLKLVGTETNENGMEVVEVTFRNDNGTELGKMLVKVRCAQPVHEIIKESPNYEYKTIEWIPAPVDVIPSVGVGDNIPVMEEPEVAPAAEDEFEDPTVIPNPTVTPEPEPTVTPEPEPTVTPEPEPTVTPEPEPTVTPEPEPTVTPEPEPTVTPEPEPTVTPEPEPTVTPEPEPTVTPEPEPTVTPEPEPTVTPEPEQPTPEQPTPGPEQPTPEQPTPGPEQPEPEQPTPGPEQPEPEQPEPEIEQKNPERQKEIVEESQEERSGIVTPTESIEAQESSEVTERPEREAVNEVNPETGRVEKPAEVGEGEEIRREELPGGESENPQEENEVPVQEQAQESVPQGVISNDENAFEMPPDVWRTDNDTETPVVSNDEYERRLQEEANANEDRTPVSDEELERMIAELTRTEQ